MMINIRTIEQKDNPYIATIIKKSLEEFGVNMPGTVYTDPTTNDLFTLFKENGSVYFIAEEKEKVIGGCGIFPTPGLPLGYAELVKLYLHKDARGKNIGFELMRKSMEWAKSNGYSHLYLESFPELSNAVHLYKKLGFDFISTALGNSGHFACTIWMTKKL